MRRLGAVMFLSAIVIAGCASATPSPSPPRALDTASSSPVTASASPVKPSIAPSASAPQQPPTGTTVRPVKGDGRDLGTQIRMAEGPDGRLWISIPEKDGVTLLLIDSAGKASPGWPIALPGVETCDQLLAADNATVRVICSLTPPAGSFDVVSRAFAFDANADALPGWPVDIKDGSIARVVGQDVIVLVNPLLHEGGEAGDQWPVSMAVIGKDGRLRRGVEVPFPCCDSDWVIGTDGIAYGVTRRGWETASSIKTDVTGFGLEGRRQGWPVTIDGNASNFDFDASGLAYAVVDAPGRTTRTIVFDQDGHQRPNGSADQAIVSTGTFDGASGEDIPGPPIVADDGTVYIISTAGGTTAVVGLDPSGKPLAGWPYKSKLDMQWTGFCGDGDTGCGYDRTEPAIGPDNALYLLNDAATSSTGGSMVAIGADGRVRDGWPVGLKRAGSAFWAMAVDREGLSWALAIEPEKQGSSATVLAIAADGTVLSATTIVEP